jgi:prepilin-type processing-associated H-X9-DG protein
LNQHHLGRFNYAFVDGHVEMLLPGKTSTNTTSTVSYGGWSILVGD